MGVLAAAAGLFPHVSPHGPAARGRAASIVAATFLLVPLFILAATLPGSVRGVLQPTLVFTTSPTSIVAGHTSAIITIQRQDGGGTPTTSGVLTVNLSTDSAGHFRNVADDTTITSVDIPDTQDSASFRYVDTATPGASLTAAATLYVSAQQAIGVTPAALDHFVVSAPASTTAGAAFDVTATAYDQYGNIKTDYAGTIHFSSSDGNPFPATLPGDYPFGGGDAGSHTFSSGVTLFNTPSQTVTVTDLSDSSKTGQATVGLPPAALDHFVVSAPASTTAGAAFDVTATAYDQYGNIKTDYAGTIHFSSSDGNPFPAPLPGDDPCGGGDAGSHTFSSGVTLFNTPSQTVTVTDLSDSSKTGQATVGVTPAALDHFVVSAPASTTAGAAFDVTATAYDQYGNIKTDYAGTIHFSSSDGNPFPATLPGDCPFGGGDAVSHTFSSGVTLFNTPSQTVTVTDLSDSSKTGQATVGVTPAALDHFVVSAPASTTAGAAFDVTATAYDQYGNIKTDYAGTIHFSSSDGNPSPATLPGDSPWGGGDAGSHTFSSGVTLFNTPSQTVTVTDLSHSSKTGQATVGVTPA